MVEKQKPEDELNPAGNLGQDKIDDIVDDNLHASEKVGLNSRSKDLASRESSASYSADDDFDIDSADIEEREKKGDWVTNMDEDAKKDSRLSSIIAHKKRVLILSVIIIPTFTILGLMFSLLSGALGIVNLKETAVSKLAQRADDVMTHRMNRVMYKKFSQDFTSGCTIKVKCRYKGMSTREVKKFNKRNKANGIAIETESSLIPGRQKIKRIIKYQPADNITLDKNGNVIDKDGRSIAKKSTIQSWEAKDFKKALREDPLVGKSMRTFYKSYVQYSSGFAARAMLKRIGVNLGKKTIKENDETDEAKKKRGEQRNLIEAAQEGTKKDLGEVGKTRYDDLPDDARSTIEERTNQIESELEDTSRTSAAPDPSSSRFEGLYGKAAKKIQNIGGGVSGAIHPNPFHFLLNYCTMRALVQTANQARKVNQTIQLIKFSALFYTIADQIKAGDATPQTTEAMGTAMGILMTQDKDGLSGFDSMGFNWITRKTVRLGDGEDVTKFQNGGSASGLLGGLVSSTTSGLGPFCKLANDPKVTAAMLTVDALSLVAGFFTGGTATAGIQAIKQGGIQGGKQFAKKLTGEILETGVKNLITKQIGKKLVYQTGEKAGEKKSKGRLAWEAINNKFVKFGAITTLFLYGTGPLIETLSRSGSNAVAQDLEGPDGGNAFYAGAGALNSKTSQAQGLQPISAEEAAAQDKSATKSTFARAKLDGINQFDISNQYSLSNSFALALAPSLSQFSKPSTFFGGFSRIYASAINNTLGTAYADENDIAQYQYCKDEDYLGASTPIAGDPFCNPQFGFETEVVNGSGYEPEAVANYVYDNGYVDGEGKPIGEFSDFIKKCLESETTIGQNEEGKVEDDCVSRDDKFRAMRMYCVDSSIDTDMNDGESPSCSPEVQGDSSSDPASDVAAEDIDIATLYDDSSSIACAEGTSDVGVVDDAYHSGNKFKARLCSIDGVTFTGETAIPGTNGKAVINSRVSAAVVKMLKAAKADGISLSISSAYRSNSKQTELHNCAPGCTGGNPAAAPGYSNHQSGVALDVNEPLNSWMRSNGSRYGYKWFGSGDPVHFSPEGN